MRRTWFVLALAGCLASCILAGCTTYPEPAFATGVGESDRELANEVSNRLEQDTLAGVLTFGVTAQNGVVTIQGSIPDETMRARVLSIVRSTPGVTGVIDKLYRM